jgi:hypothetical protein
LANLASSGEFQKLLEETDAQTTRPAAANQAALSN